jgi:transcriptional regulator with XRE-family HTH domain
MEFQSLADLKFIAKQGNIKPYHKRQIPTAEDQQMALMLQKHLDSPIKFEDVPEEHFWTDTDPYSKWRRRSAPYKVNKKVWALSKLSLLPDSPVKNLINNTKISIQNEFIRFMSLPKDMKMQAYGFDTKLEFAKQFGVSKDTLSNWSKDEDVQKKIDVEMLRRWKELNNDVIQHLYSGIKKYGDAARIKLWLEKIAQFKDEKIIDNHFTFEWVQPNNTMDESRVIQIQNNGEDTN